jgi:hypothetical protein
MILSTKNNTFYVVDYLGNQIFTLSDDWEFISSTSSFNRPTCMIVENSNIYIAGDMNVWKTDIYLNVINQFNATTAYRGIYVDSVKSLVYVVNTQFNRIDIFDLNLNLNDSISLLTYAPWGLSGYNNQLIVGTLSGAVLAIVNKTIINSVNGCNDNSAGITSILFDDYDYMATSCDDPVNQLFLYFLNGSFTGKSISTPYRTFKIGFDSKNRFYILSMNQISLFNREEKKIEILLFF